MTISYPWNCCLRHSLKRIYNGVLNKDVFIEQWIFPKDTPFKAFETKNFGWIVFPAETKDKRGFIVPRRIFKW